MTVAPPDTSIEMRASSPARRTTAERLVLTLTCLGMTAALVRHISFQETRSQFAEDLVARPDIPQSPVYYVAHTIQLLLLLSAGLIALFSLDIRTIKRGYALRFALLVAVSLLTTARGYSLSDLLSTKLVGSNGPFPFLISVLVFVGAQRRNWVVLSRALVILAVVLSALVLARLTGLHTLTRAEGVANLGSFLNALLWPASWIALEEHPRESWTRRLRFGPILIYGLGSLFTQTRLNFVMIFALLAVYTYVQRKRHLPQTGAFVAVVALAVWLSLFTAVFLRDTRAFENTVTVIDAFYSRIDDDSRTGQLQAFFADVKPWELLFGRGALATWRWGRSQWEGTDVGYLTLLFYGGVPLLFTYVVTHVTPGLTVLRKKPADSRLAAAGVVVLWSIVMLSSAYPGPSLEHYPILFCVGACISWQPFPAHQPIR
jgi:hypothetical protein